jgi:hypothetical protein
MSDEYSESIRLWQQFSVQNRAAVSVALMEYKGRAANKLLIPQTKSSLVSKHEK